LAEPNGPLSCEAVGTDLPDGPLGARSLLFKEKAFAESIKRLPLEGKLANVVSLMRWGAEQ